MKNRVILIAIVIVMVCGNMALAGGRPEAAAQSNQLTIWSQWASEPAAVEAIRYVVDGYQRANPDIEVELTFFDRGQLEETFRTVMAAGGVGAPDLISFSSWLPVVEPGWVIPLDDVIDESRFVSGAIERWQAGSSPLGVYRFPTYVAISLILYNPEAFQRAGITVPQNRPFTSDEWLENVRMLRAAGYAGVSNAVGDRPYPGQYFTHYHALTKLGYERYRDLFSGYVDWSDPDVREILEYVVKMRAAGMFHEAFQSMGLEEMHVNFHTQHRSAMLYIGSWYVNRAFQSPDRGGQSPNFRFGMLQYPSFPNSRGEGVMFRQSGSGGFGIVSSSQNKDTARDFLRHWQSMPTYGAVYAALSNQVAALRNDPATDLPAEFAGRTDEWAWYHSEMARVYGNVERVPDMIGESLSGDYNNAMLNVLNSGLPGGLMTVDQAIRTLNDARRTVPPRS